jgi:hypothetical protein
METWRSLMRKRTIFLALSLTVFGFSLAHAASMSSHELNIDRPGADFDHFVLPHADPLLCEHSCGADTRCAAWNYDPATPPGTVQNPQCFLKESAPHPTLRLHGVISGVKIRP